MKRKTFMRIVVIMLAMILTVASLTGCAANGNNVADTNVVEEEDGTVGLNTNGMEKDLVQYIKTGFTASDLPEAYNQPMYDLPADYVFEFECSERVGMVVHDAFKVYNSPELSNLGGMSFNWNTYENGKITVAPQGALYLSEEGSENVDDGTWGSLNELYLVQYINLETGEKLETPIVTPFTVQHDLDAPVITQGVDENNCYVLSWQAVPGAVEYRVYEYFMDYGYKVECVTGNTSALADEFESQKRIDEYTELLAQDLQEAGYPETVTTQDGVAYMNYALKYDDEMEDGYFLVVAVGENGEQSGISNIVDVRDIAMRLPYQICDTSVEVNIDSVEDIPTYVDVEMIDGSVQQMIIDYHGAQTYIYPDDELKMSIRAHVANTLFDKFFITLHGMKHADVMAESTVITERQDELLSRIGSGQNPEINVSYTPSEEINEKVEQLREEFSEMEISTEEPEESEEVSEEVSVQLLNETVSEVQKRIDILGSEKVDTVLYASNDLQAWMAMCLLAQSQIIPIPIEVFPDAANLDYVSGLFVEAYRQNPTSGVINDIRYSTEYQALVVEYVEEAEDRLAKAQEELDAAFEIKSQIIKDGMSDYEKVVAINEYFRLNASYDFDSTTTEVEDYSTISESFIDAHTPYGIICNNYGVCESYAEAFVLVARAAGLEAMCELGTLYGGGHEWNRVKVGGSWCVLDITNNDIEIFINGFLNVTDEQVAGVLVPDYTSVLNHEKYAATDYTKEYYYVNGCAVSDLSEADELLAEQLQNSDSALIRIPAACAKEELEHVLEELVYGQGVNFGNAGVKMNLLCVMK